MKKQTYASVWDALEDTPEAAASMRVRAELMIAVQRYVEANGETQAQANDVFPSPLAGEGQGERGTIRRVNAWSSIQVLGHRFFNYNTRNRRRRRLLRRILLNKALLDDLVKTCKKARDWSNLNSWPAPSKN